MINKEVFFQHTQTTLKKHDTQSRQSFVEKRSIS